MTVFMNHMPVSETASLHLFNFTFAWWVDSQENMHQTWTILSAKDKNFTGSSSSSWQQLFPVSWFHSMEKLKTMKIIPPDKNIIDDEFDPSYWNVLSSHQQLLERQKVRVGGSNSSPTVHLLECPWARHWTPACLQCTVCLWWNKTPQPYSIAALWGCT